MQPKEYLKNKARKLAKQTWAGPGKFGVFIILCIIVVAAFESLGLSNREKNLEMRNVQNIVIPVHHGSEKIEPTDVTPGQTAESFNEKLKKSALIDFEKKNLERENILLFGAVEQFLFEHRGRIENYDSITTQQEKNKYFISLILTEGDNLVQRVEEDLFVIDI